ncbi:transcription antitermination factor NusB [Mesomycoplasma neurolyticum]|uniref:Transcription termination factor n=1 Tax=Mesomycoplasma neurolyticum TaxID=2120 RepID=A0A449A526_9BACT|nr:transcription antitermination factor NusB [Mesomycoplasma neurolyticum]VEU59314.1 transcription termination factor [Mesomycoplasma neurolyticum]
MEQVKDNFKSNSNENRLTYRKMIISILYQFELENLIVNSEVVNKKFKLNQQEKETISFIEKRYTFFRASIIKFLEKKETTWRSTKPLIRAILIFGTFELLYITKEIVINEFVELTKIYTLEEKENDYKFVNAILQKVSELFETTEKKKTN